jgi:hypothetical protein
MIDKTRNINKLTHATLLTSTGYGNTGSSAGTNILEEFNCVKSCNNSEFSFAHEPDGLADLENSLKEGHRLKTDLAVKRFLKLSNQLGKEPHYNHTFNGKFEQFAVDFIDSVIKCSWDDGWWHRAFEADEFSRKNIYRRRMAKEAYNIYLKNALYDAYEPDGWRPHFIPGIKEYYSNFIDDNDKEIFISKAKLFTDKLLHETDKSNKYKYILLDQAIPPIAPFQYTQYFTDPKVLVIDRDPRDLYILNKAIWGTGYIPSSTVAQFINWYSITRKLREKELNDNSLILFMQFEALVYDYDDSLQKIMEFANLSECDHKKKLEHFNPELSKANTQKFLFYPDLYADVRKIEKELGEYCYSFHEIPQNITKKYFIIQNVVNKVSNIQHTGKIPVDLKKYAFFIFYRSSCFYRTMNILKERIISSIKKTIKLFLRYITINTDK